MPWLGSPIALDPIGYVRSPVKPGQHMPHGGVRAVVEILPRYVEGLRGIEGNTHIWVLGWLQNADRSRLLSRSGRGVFGSRAPNRPNPVGLTVCRLLGREGASLQVDHLDFYDATPVLDIKRYSPSWDCVFSASSPWELEQHDLPERELVTDFLQQAANYHGEECRSMALAVRMTFRASVVLGCSPRCPELHVEVPTLGCLSDGLQGITGATFGLGRIAVGKSWKFSRPKRGSILFTLKEPLPQDGDLLSVSEADLFQWKTTAM